MWVIFFFSMPKEIQIFLPGLGEWYGCVIGVCQSLLTRLGQCLGENVGFMGQDAHGRESSLDRGSLWPTAGTEWSTLGNSWHSLCAAPGTLECFTVLVVFPLNNSLPFLTWDFYAATGQRKYFKCGIRYLYSFLAQLWYRRTDVGLEMM